MRRFNKEERSVLIKLINAEDLKSKGMMLLDTFLEDNFFSDGHNKSIHVDPKAGKLSLSINSLDVDECKKELIATTRLIHLLMDLESMGLASYIGNPSLKEKNIGEKFADGTTINITESLSDFMSEKLGSLIFPSKALEKIVNSNFKVSNGRLRSTMISLVSIAVAMLFGFSLCVFLCYDLWGT